MNRQDAERITTEYLKPIFGFALRRCKSIHDAEDLSQEIVLKVFRALLSRDDIADTRKFIWTISHNALSNYYRDCAKTVIGTSIDEAAELITDPASEPDAGDNADSIHRLQSEIAYLSKLQRRIIIAYYFENRKQADIASELKIPVGTVKWHLFEAKKELKRGMDTMRKASELKFNPIRFSSYGINGSAGTKSLEEFFRATLPQNICYSVRQHAKTVNEIADDLGVSPVYVESEAEFLEEYGFLLKQKEKYISNFIIEEPTEELLAIQNQMYAKGAMLYANDLYDALTSSGILDDPAILCNQTDEPVSLTGQTRADHNFLLWSLIPYITANSGKRLLNIGVTRDEVSTYRPDGAHNIFKATIYNPELKKSPDILSLGDFCGPMWNEFHSKVLWQIDSAWSDRGEIQGYQYFEDARRTLCLFAREQEAQLSKDDYAWLAERGYIKTNGDYDGLFKSSWQIVILTDRQIQEKLLKIGEQVKAKHADTFEALKRPYAQMALASVPPHLRKVKEYELQFVFHDDARFLLHCMHALLENGKVKEPTQGQRKAVTTLICNA